MDFYVANRAQRRSWRGDGEVRLAASSDNKEFVTYGGSGQGAALFALHPAEPKSYRIGRKEAGSGASIEDADDGGGGLTIEFTGANGQPVTIDVGAAGLSMDALREALDAQGFTAPEGAPARTGEILTAVEYVANWYIQDGIGSAEVEWKAWKFIGGSGSSEYKLWTGVDYLDVLLSNTGCDGSHSGCYPFALQMWAWVPSSGQSVKAQVWETDTGADDLYGTGYWDNTEGGVTKTFWGGPDYCSYGGAGVACADGRVNYY
jgi:hypothetical protein